MSIVGTAKDLLASAARSADIGAADEKGPVSVTILAGTNDVRNLWTDASRLSTVFADLASVEDDGADGLLWSIGESRWHTSIVDFDSGIRYPLNDGSAELLRVGIVAAPRNLGTEVTLNLDLPVPDVAAKAAAFAILYRTRALLQTGEIPTLVPTPAARPGDH